jgi:hypothetical protein
MNDFFHIINDHNHTKNRKKYLNKTIQNENIVLDNSINIQIQSTVYMHKLYVKNDYDRNFMYLVYILCLHQGCDYNYWNQKDCLYNLHVKVHAHYSPYFQTRGHLHPGQSMHSCTRLHLLWNILFFNINHVSFLDDSYFNNVCVKIKFNKFYAFFTKVLQIVHPFLQETREDRKMKHVNF